MKKYILQKKCNLVGGRNLLNSPKPKHSLLFTAIFSFSVFNLQAQTSTKTLKLFAPPNGETTDSILVWHSDSTVRKISNSQISSIEPWNEATTTNQATGNTQNIYQNGKIGIGDFNATTPATALDIENGTTAGAIKIVDGTQQSGRVLTSDDNGVGTWQLPGTIGNKIAVWTFSSPENISTAGASLVTTTNATSNILSINEIGAALGTNVLTLPAGRYIVFVHLDVSNAEYCSFTVNDATLNIQLLGTIYGEMLNCTFFYQSNDIINLQYNLRGYLNNPNTGYYNTSYSNVGVSATTTILKLN